MVADDQDEAKRFEESCLKISNEYKHVFKNEQGCLNDFETEIKFKSTSKPIICKPRKVPLAIMDNFNNALD